MRLLLFIFFLFPVCAMAQIEVVNESMICDSLSNVLEIGKFNYLRFKNLPDSAVVSVSKGIIKPDVKRKNVYYIPGAKLMEGKLTDLSATKNGKIIFSKSYRFRKVERYIDPVDTNYSGLPFRLGKRKLGKGGSYSVCKAEILDDPAFYPLLDGYKIESFEVSIFFKRQDGIGPLKIIGSTIPEIVINSLKNNCYVLMFEHIFFTNSDNSCSEIPWMVVNIKEQQYGNKECDKSKVK